MKNFFLFIFLFSVGNTLLSQQGKATYSVKTSLGDDFKLNSRIPKQVAERIKKGMSEPILFELFFDQKQSVYKIEEKLDSPRQGGNRMRWFSSWGKGGSQIVHSNLSSKVQTIQQELFGKLFLITDTLSSSKWKFTGKQKKIGNYTAYEAQYSETQNIINMNFWSGRNNSPNDSIKTKDVKVSVWFTPEIPVSAGPSKYFGLPGLVLMVQDDKKMLICNEIKLNINEKISLDAPKRGDVVTRYEFDEIQKIKTEEMKVRFQNNRNGGGGNYRMKNTK